MITIPSSSLASSAGGSPQLIMQFARASGTVVFSLSIGSLNSSGGFSNQSWAYAYAPYKVTTTGDPITKFRLAFSGIVNGDWQAVGPIEAGTYWLTGLQLTALSWNSTSGDKSASVGAGAFKSTDAPLDVTASFTPKHFAIVQCGEDGKEAAYVRYRLEQTCGGDMAWSWTPSEDANRLLRFK